MQPDPAASLTVADWIQVAATVLVALATCVLAIREVRRKGEQKDAADGQIKALGFSVMRELGFWTWPAADETDSIEQYRQRAREAIEEVNEVEPRVQQILGLVPAASREVADAAWRGSFLFYDIRQKLRQIANPIPENVQPSEDQEMERIERLYEQALGRISDAHGYFMSISLDEMTDMLEEVGPPGYFGSGS